MTAGRSERSRGELLLHQLHFWLDPKLLPPSRNTSCILRCPEHNCPDLHRHHIQPKYTLWAFPLPSPSRNSEQNSRFIWVSDQTAKQPHQRELLPASCRLRRWPGLARLQCSHLRAVALPATPDSFGRERTSKSHRCSPRNLKRRIVITHDGIWLARKIYYSRSHGSRVTQGQAGGKRTLNHQLQTLPSPATMSHNPIRKSIMEILKLAQFSAPRGCRHPAL